MPDLLISKPEDGEYAAYFSRYIDMVPDGDIVGTLSTQIGVTLAELRKISDANSRRRYEVGKWSVREMVGHMIDTERVFAFRALHFARNDQSKLPGFEQDDYIAAANFDDRAWSDLVDEFYTVRRATIAFFRGLPAEAWTRKGIANENTMSVRAAAYIIAGHERHHMGVLRDRYTMETLN